MRLSIISLVLFVYANLSMAFIPSVPALLAEGVYQGRKGESPWEVVLKHTVHLNGQSPMVIEETIMCSPNQRSFSWKMGGDEVVAERKSEDYVVSGGERWESRSELVVEYLCGRDAKGLQRELLSEKFLLTEQLGEFKPGFEPEGDPRNWNLKENRRRPQGVGLKRIDGKKVIAVSGLLGRSDGRERNLYLDPRGRGVVRFEWVESGQTLYWGMKSLSKIRSGGLYPQRMIFDVGGAEIIVTDLVISRSLKEADFRTRVSSLRQKMQTPLTNPSLRTALKILTSFR